MSAHTSDLRELSRDQRDAILEIELERRRKIGDAQRARWERYRERRATEEQVDLSLSPDEKRSLSDAYQLLGRIAARENVDVSAIAGYAATIDAKTVSE